MTDATGTSVRCPKCKGRGQVPLSASVGGVVGWSQSCSECGGKGFVDAIPNRVPPLPPADLPNVYVEKGGFGGGRTESRPPHTTRNRVRCPKCKGKGGVPLSAMTWSQSCSECGGAGVVDAIPNRVTYVCDRCGMEGAPPISDTSQHIFCGGTMAPTPPAADATRNSVAGLHGKYFGLRRTRDGSEVDGWYFVLREDDPHAWAALEAYAASCDAENPDLAADLRATVRDAQMVQGLGDAGWER